jgi:TRAP-type uncharacterized transport system substrate-binding protein
MPYVACKKRIIMRFRKMLLTLLLVIPLPGIHADESAGAESGLVISAGREGLGYWGIATRLQAVALESELPVDVRESVGSMENLERLADPDSPVSLALTQSDALHAFLGTHPGSQADIEIFESIGKECVFVIADKDSGLRSDADLSKPDSGHRLAIQDANSGSAITFEVMRKLDPDLGNTEVVYMDTRIAMDQMGAESPDIVDAVMLVHRPKVHSPELQRALSNPDRFQLVSFDNADLRGKLPNGDPIYAPLDVPLIRSGWKTERSVQTICVKGLLVGSRSKLSPDDRDRLMRIIDYQWMRVYSEEG